MVTKKTANENVKNVATPVANKKNAPKSSVKKASAPKPVKNGATPITENKDIVSSVLEIKAQNEAKKTSKTVSDKKETKQKSAPFAKGNKVSSAKVKKDAVKEKVQQAEAKKFVALKEEKALEVSDKKACPCCCVLSGFAQAFKAWGRGYKNIFNYKGRTSRYDYWAFMLINLILSLFVILPFQAYNINTLVTHTTMAPNIVYAYWGFLLVEILVYFSLTIRRLHDTGASGWKGFFRPMTYTILGVVVLAVIAGTFFQQDTVPPQENSVSENLLAMGVFLLLLMNFYYVIKIFIAAGFMEEEKNENAYGVPTFIDDCCRAKILRFSSLYLLIFFIYLAVMMTIQYYLAFSLLMNGAMF